MSVVLQGRVGPILAQDGAEEAPRLGKTLETIVGDAHGRYWESVSRGNVFMASNTAAQAVTAVATLTGTGLFLTNPLGSGKVLSLLQIDLGLAAVAGAVINLVLAAGVNIISAAVVQTSAIVPTNALLGCAKKGVGLTASAITQPSAATIVRSLWGASWITGGELAGPPGPIDIGGSIALLPNTYLGIFGVGTLTSILGGFLWEEIDLPAAGI